MWVVKIVIKDLGVGDPRILKKKIKIGLRPPNLFVVNVGSKNCNKRFGSGDPRILKKK